MKKVLFAVAALAFITAASAKDVTVTLNDDEQHALMQLLDMSVKSGGLGVAEAGLHFAKKLQPQAQALPEGIKREAKPAGVQTEPAPAK